MIQSMTGYGRAEGQAKNVTLSVEMRSVNHRHASVAVRLPRLFAGLEEAVKKKVQSRFERGRIDLSVNLNGAGASGKQFVLNLEEASSYHAILKTLKKSLGLSGEIDIALMSQFRDVIAVKEVNAPSPALETLLNQTLARAMVALEKMRKHEGKALVSDLKTRLRHISKILAAVKKQEQGIMRSHQKRLQSRIAELTGGIEVDPIRLAQEVAIIAERSDISEERIRLAAHIDQFKSLLKTGGVLGRTLDFLIQEMFREVNTLGSKSADQAISMSVLAMKGELEKMREQVQNIA